MSFCFSLSFNTQDSTPFTGVGTYHCIIHQHLRVCAQFSVLKTWLLTTELLSMLPHLFSLRYISTKASSLKTTNPPASSFAILLGLFVSPTPYLTLAVAIPLLSHLWPSILPWMPHTLLAFPLFNLDIALLISTFVIFSSTFSLIVPAPCIASMSLLSPSSSSLKYSFHHFFISPISVTRMSSFPSIPALSPLPLFFSFLCQKALLFFRRFHCSCYPYPCPMLPPSPFPRLLCFLTLVPSFLWFLTRGLLVRIFLLSHCFIASTTLLPF